MYWLYEYYIRKTEMSIPERVKNIFREACGYCSLRNR